MDFEGLQQEQEQLVADALAGLTLPSHDKLALVNNHNNVDIISSDDTETDEEEEDEGDDESVTLGFVRKPQDPSLLARQFFPSKAGGSPAWLDPVDIPDREKFLCGMCGNPLQFLMQVYAPIDGKEYAFHRTLFVFMCPSMKCLRQDQIEQRNSEVDQAKRSVKVFRCQLPRSNPFYSMDPPKQEGDCAPLTSGGPLCSWCQTWQGGKICSGCKSCRYCSRQHQVDHWRRSHSVECRQIQTMLAGSNTINSYNNISPENKGLWPELEIIDDEEDLDEAEDCDPLTSQNIVHSIADNDRSTDEIVKEFQSFEASKDQEHWALFQTRISSAPDQVLRYCRHRNAKILWPRLEGQLHVSDIPKCHICSGPRRFEFQVLPQLLYFFKIQNENDSLDWATIVIYSCEASCNMKSSGYVEEFAWVQLAL